MRQKKPLDVETLLGKDETWTQDIWICFIVIARHMNDDSIQKEYRQSMQKYETVIYTKRLPVYENRTIKAWLRNRSLMSKTDTAVCTRFAHLD